MNRLIDQPLLPTSGTGTPRSQTPCSCSLPALPVNEKTTWDIGVDWLPPDAAVALLAGPQDPRADLIRRDLPDDARASFGARLGEILRQAPGPGWLLGLAAGRDTGWVGRDRALDRRETQRVLGPLTGGWAAALTTRVSLRARGRHTIELTDLPGVGHDDAGGRATEGYLSGHAWRSDAIVCVLGQNGLGQPLAALLLRHWSRQDLLRRLHLVSTYVDRGIEDADSAPERSRAAERRCRLAVEQVGSLLKAGPEEEARLLDRTYCVDARRANRWQTPLSFTGEIKRLRSALAPSGGFEGGKGR